MFHSVLLCSIILFCCILCSKLFCLILFFSFFSYILFCCCFVIHSLLLYFYSILFFLLLLLCCLLVFCFCFYFCSIQLFYVKVCFVLFFSLSCFVFLFCSVKTHTVLTTLHYSVDLFSASIDLNPLGSIICLTGWLLSWLMERHSIDLIKDVVFECGSASPDWSECFLTITSSALKTGICLL